MLRVNGVGVVAHLTKSVHESVATGGGEPVDRNGDADGREWFADAGERDGEAGYAGHGLFLLEREAAGASGVELKLEAGAGSFTLGGGAGAGGFGDEAGLLLGGQTGDDSAPEGSRLEGIAGAGLHDPAEGLGGLDHVDVAHVDALELTEVDGFVVGGVEPAHEREGFLADGVVAAVFAERDEPRGKFVGLAQAGLSNVTEIAQAAEDAVEGGFGQTALLAEIGEREGAVGAREDLDDGEGLGEDGDAAHVYPLLVSRCEINIPLIKTAAC